MRPTRHLIPVALVFLALGCSSGSAGPEPEDVISRDTFVQTYFQLRLAALRSPGAEISIESRDQVLQEMGLTPEDLEKFVEVRGEEGQLMLGIWQEVDSLLRSHRRSYAEGEPRPGVPGREGPERERPRPGGGGAGPGGPGVP